MASRAEHYREAERLLEAVAKNDRQYADTRDMMADEANMLAKAQVRATLATTSDETYNEYLDLTGTEAMREKIVGQPGPQSRDWLKDDDE